VEVRQHCGANLPAKEFEAFQILASEMFSTQFTPFLELIMIGS
jgi:hypothetical protein